MLRGLSNIIVMSFNAPISAPNGTSTQKRDKMSGFVKASWRGLGGFHHQDNFMDSPFWMVYIWNKSTNLSLKGEAYPWAALTGAEQAATRQTTPALSQALFSTPLLGSDSIPSHTAQVSTRTVFFLHSGYVLDFIENTASNASTRCFPYCWAVLTESQGLSWLSSHPVSE